jgi:hypothetical protein
VAMEAELAAIVRSSRWWSSAAPLTNTTTVTTATTAMTILRGALGTGPPHNDDAGASGSPDRFCDPAPV